MAFFQQKDQEIFMFPETSTYCTPLNGTLITANPATYPWYTRLNLIPEAIDWDMPIIIKEKIYSIGSGKHPSHIVNKMRDPVEITLDMYMQDARFFAMATGTSSTTGEQKVVQTITPGTWAQANVDGAYFLFYVTTAAYHQKCYAVYMDVNSDQGGAPSITGATNVNIDFLGTDNLSGVNVTDIATLLDEMELALEALTEITAITTTATVLTTTTVATAGAVMSPRNGASSPVFTFAVTTEGASTHTITESTDTSLPSFGLHIEQLNSGQDIIVDLYGCVITNHEVTIDYSEQLIKESVTIQAVYGAIGDESTCPPPKRTLAPHTWQNLSEDENKHVIMIGTTDKTPAILKSLTFTIANDVEFFPDIGKDYMYYPIAGKREPTMKLTGFIQIKDIWTYWKDTWSDSDDCYTDAGGKLNSYITIERTATHDTMYLTVDNWMIEEYALKLFHIDDKIMGIDVTFTGATPATVGSALIDGFVITDYTPKIFYNEANS